MYYNNHVTMYYSNHVAMYYNIQTDRVMAGRRETLAHYLHQMSGQFMVSELLKIYIREDICCGDGTLKPQHFDDEMLHSEELSLRVSIVGDVDKLPHVRWVDLLKLTTTQKIMDDR